MFDAIGKMFEALFTNIHIRTALIAMLVAQVLKIFFYSIKHKKINFKVFVQTGGMPSSHTAMVMGMTTSVGVTEGWNSVAFALALIFSFIVMYDAAGVRRAAGRQAIVLNKIIDDLVAKKAIKEQRVKEFLGHTPLEVFFGFLLGVAIAFIVHHRAL